MKFIFAKKGVVKRVVLTCPREGLVRERTCVTPLGVMPRTYKKVTSRSRERGLFQATVLKGRFVTKLFAR